MKILAIYYSPKTVDCYTVITDAIDKYPGDEPMRDQFPYLGCDDNGGHSFSQWGFIERPTYAELLNKQTQDFRKRTHLGVLVPFEQLNAETQEHIAYRLWQ
jgi:hypothetical protein